MNNVKSRKASDPAPLPHPSVDTQDWAALLASRTDEGLVDPNVVAHVFRNVELDAEMIRHIESVLSQHNISVGNLEPDISGPIPRLRERTPDLRRPERRPVLPTKVAKGETGDAVRMYLQEIGQVDLLTAEDERRLGKAIRAMQEAKEKIAADGATAADRRELRSVILEGEDAFEHLITANLRLVVSIARRYDGRELQLQDLIQEGNIGLMRAAEKYDWEKGFKFSTYATWWIRQAMMRAMADQGRTIRIPSHVVELMHRLTKADRELTVELNREPTVSELSARTLIEPDRIAELRQISAVTLSLDEPIGSEDDDMTWGDRFGGDEADSPAAIAQRRQLIMAVITELEHLPDRDRRILDKRFGISTGEPLTLDDVAKQEGVTRERIRQIEQKTLARLRHPNNSQRLRGYLDSE